MRSRILAVGAVIALLTVACGNAGDDESATTTVPSNQGPATTASAADLDKNVPVDAPGVTDDEIKVAVITSKTNNPTGSYGPLVDGIKAYFEKVNEAGGIYGRKLVVASDRDDGFTQNRQTVQASLSRDDAFATFIATTFFTGSELLAKANQPVFMWNINAEFADHPTFFADKGALCFTCAGHITPWLVNELGLTKVGLLAYGGAPQAADCATGVKNSFKEYGGDASIVFEDQSIGFAQPLGPQVTEMKQKGVQFVLTCVDLQEAFTLAKEMRKQGLDAAQQLPFGYNHDFISKNAALEGSYVIPQFVAFEQEPQIQEIQDLFTYTDKIGVDVSELTASGWIIASQLYEGLRGAGPEFSQEKVVNYLNTLTDYTDNGFTQPLNWTKGHDDPLKNPDSRPEQECANFVRVEGGKFVPEFGEPGKPWVCFKIGDPSLEPTYQSFAP